MRLLTLLLTASFALTAQADERPYVPAPDGLRAGGTLFDTLPAPPIAGEPRASGREVRNYPEQPPVIPHSIRNYQVDSRFNRCMDCHSRDTAPAAGAPMVSITHYVDRHGQTRAAVTPGRYFCTQCHVPQTDADPLVQSSFQSIDQLLQRDRQGGQP